MTNGLFGWLTFAPAFELQLSAVSIVAKVTIVLLIAAIASLALRNASPALRHRVWLTAIVASVLMPAFAFLPSVSVELPSAAYLVQPRTNGVPVKASVTPDRTTEPSPRAEARGPQTSSPNAPATNSRFRINSGYSSFFPANKPSLQMYRDRDGSFHYAEPRMVPEKAFGNPSVVQKEKKSISLWMVGFAIWAGGSILLLAWRLCGYALLARMIAECKSFSDPAWQRDLERLTSRSGRARTVRLLQHPSLRSPVTAGWLHPVIMLPEVASTMLADERRAVLAHELSHIERSDFVTQAVGSFATSLFWFHPLIWLAVSRMRTESECAADDSVLMSGLDAPSYARQLLQMAKQTNGFGADAIPVVAMARASQLERRIRLLLDLSRQRNSLPLRRSRAITVLSAVSLLPIGVVKLESHAQAEGSASNLVQLPTRAIAFTSQETGRQITTESDSLRSTAKTTLADGDSKYPKLHSSNFEADSVIEESVQMSAAETVDLHVLSGANVVIRGWNEQRAVMRASFGGQAWRQARASLQRTPNGIYVGSVSGREGYRVVYKDDSYVFGRIETDSGSPAPPSVDHLIEVWVPQRSNIVVNSIAGSVAIENINGDLKGMVDVGDLRLENVSGLSAIKTRFGNIKLLNASLSGSATTECGTVSKQDVTGAFNATTAFDPAPFRNTIASRVVLEGIFPEDYCNARLRRLGLLSNRLTENNRDGDIVIESAPNGGTLSNSGGGAIVVRSSGGHISATTSGSIELLNVRGDATARSNGGQITVSISNSDGTDHLVNIQNTGGNVVVELPDTLDSSVRAEVVTTKEYLTRTGRFARMIDGYGLVGKSLSSEPQEAVRLSGMTGHWMITKGNGIGRILVRVTDGDIIFRRTRR